MTPTLARRESNDDVDVDDDIEECLSLVLFPRFCPGYRASVDGGGCARACAGPFPAHVVVSANVDSRLVHVEYPKVALAIRREKNIRRDPFWKGSKERELGRIDPKAALADHALNWYVEWRSK